MRKINEVEKARVQLCEQVLKTYRDSNGKVYGYKLCDHKATVKQKFSGYKCGRHV